MTGGCARACERQQGQVSYLVKWVGYDQQDNTWEPEEHLSCPLIVAAFNEACQATGVKKVTESRLWGKRAGGRKLGKR